MIVIFWLAAIIIVYTFGGYPLFVTVLARLVGRPVRRADITPTVTLVIPAYNEAAVIEDKIENSLALDYPRDRLEIMFVTDGSDDETPEIVARYAERGVRLCHQPQREGKLAAVNRVMPLVSSEVVVFSDANAMLDREALRVLVRNFADLAVGGVAGEKRVLQGGEGLYWRYESWLKRCDSGISSVMGAAGELFALRRTLYQSPEPDSLIEDFVMSMRLVEAGWRVVYEPEAVARESGTVTLAGEWARRTRIAAGGYQSIRRLPGLLNPLRGRVAWQYVSHRVLRWAVTPFLLPIIYGATLCLIAVPFYQWVLGAQTAFYGAAWLGYVLARRGAQHGPLHTLFYFCFTNLAALAGFWRYITGTQPVTWARSR